MDSALQRYNMLFPLDYQDSRLYHSCAFYMLHAL